MRDDDGQAANSLRGKQALRLWNHQNVAHWTVAKYLTVAWSDIALRRRVINDPVLARVTVAEVLHDNDALDAFLSECRKIPECGVRQVERIRKALLCVAPQAIEDSLAESATKEVTAPRLRIDADAKREMLRKWAFVLGNTLWDIQLFEQIGLDLRPEEDLVYRTIILASIQRILRESGPTAPVFTEEAPVPLHQITPVSMRRVAEITQIPRETVRRHVQLLKARGLVDYHPDGGVYAPNSLQILKSAGLIDVLLQSILTAVNSLIEMGVLVPEEARRSELKEGD